MAQSMQVMAFFFSDTVTVGTTSDGTTTTSATAAGDAVTSHSPTVTAIYVSGVADLTVELRPADEGVSATMFVCSAEDSDITGSSVDDVVVLSRCGNIFPEFLHWGCREHSVSGDGTPLGATTAVPQRVLVVYIGSAASWRPCNVAYPQQDLSPTAEAVRGRLTKVTSCLG